MSPPSQQVIEADTCNRGHLRLMMIKGEALNMSNSHNEESVTRDEHHELIQQPMYPVPSLKDLL